jgi:ABC-type transport system substrate-binding protein
LFRWNEGHEAIPELVDTYTVAKDGLTITMTLKPNLKYSDGSPLTIEDVLYNWDRIYKAPITDKGLTKDVASLTASGSSTLVWKFTSPNPDFLQYLGRIFLQIHPKRLLESDPKYFEHPLSAGPYVVKEWVPNSNRALLEENPNYVKGPMAIKQIEIVYVSDHLRAANWPRHAGLCQRPASRNRHRLSACGQDVRRADCRHDDDCRQRRQAGHTARQPRCPQGHLNGN